MQQQNDDFAVVNDHKNSGSETLKASDMPLFQSHMSLEQGKKLKIHDKIDHRDEVGRFIFATVFEKQGTNLKIHYDGWNRKWDTWSDFTKEIHRFASPGSISKRPAHRFNELKKRDYVDINPSQRHPGWKRGEIRRLDQKSGQVQVVYECAEKNYLYWAHLDNEEEIAQFPTMSGLVSNQNQQELFNNANKQKQPMQPQPPPKQPKHNQQQNDMIIQDEKEAEEKNDDKKSSKKTRKRKFLQQLLTEWELSQYENVLIDENGFDDILEWKEITESDLRNDMKFKPGHARKFIRKTKEYFDQMNEDNQEEGAQNETQKLHQIHQLVLQFQALENDLKDTFETIQSKHDSEMRAMRKELNALKGIEEDELTENAFFGATSLAQNPLSKQSQHQQQQQHNAYNHNPLSNHNQMQTRTTSQSVAFSPHQPSPINPSPQSNNNYGTHKQSNTMHQYSYTPQPKQSSQQQQQQQNGFNSSNAYHSKKNRSSGNVPGPSPKNNGSKNYNSHQNSSQMGLNQYSGYGQNKSKQLPPNPNNQNNANDHSSNGNNKKHPISPIANIMNKFTNDNNKDNDNNHLTLSGLDNGISERDFYKKYWIEAGKIGEGAFARVRKITRKSDKAVFALKMIKKKGKSVEDIAALQREILVLQKCDHENVIKLGDWCDTKKRIYMVVEFCDGGDVFERVVEYKKFSEKSAIHVIKQVASGIMHIHNLGFVHRDLKPDNLMYLSKDVNSDIKIIDFGLAGDVNEGPCKTPCGTAHYAAPEVLSGMEYNQSADMWSLGVILYTLLCGFPPFFDASNNMKNLYHLIKKGQYSFPSPFWDDISQSAKDLIQKLLVKDPNGRFDAKKVLEHEWIANEIKAPEDDLGGQYVKQMSHWQSTRQATEFGLGQEAPPPPPPDQPISLFYENNNNQQGNDQF